MVVYCAMKTLALKINNLVKTYPNGPQAVKGVNLEVKQGDFFALLGPNGAGKTTIIGTIASLVNKTSGLVEVMGHNIDTDVSLAKNCLGLMPQEYNFNQFEKVIDIVINQAGFYGIPRKEALVRAERYLKKLELWDKRNTVSRTLSGGMKRRLMIARALIHEPAILLLDEPTAGVDIELRRSTWEFLKEINASGTTIILTTHYLEEAESLCRGIAIIDEGKIVKNTTIKELLTELNRETIILDLKESITSIPYITGCRITKLDSMTLEICLPKTVTLNDVFRSLTKLGMSVVSMRNKANRLEELFVTLVKQKGQ